MTISQPISLPDVRVFRVKRFEDNRGFFSETYSRRLLREQGIDVEFVQDNQSLSIPAGTVRGLHLQLPPKAQHKLVRVTHGSIRDVVVDVRVGSPTFGKWTSAIISAVEWNQIYVPVGFLHGFVTLEPNTEVLYKVSDDYDRASERGVAWNDPHLAIDWELTLPPILSEKDSQLPAFASFESPFRYHAAEAADRQ